MYAAIRRAVASLCSQQVADLTKEAGSLRNQVCSLRRSRDEWRRDCGHTRARLALADQAKQASVAQAAALEQELASSKSAESASNERLLAIQGRAAGLEKELERIQAELRQAEHELDMSHKQLELACKENELLAKIHQGDLARRERELAIEKRGKTDAELASQMTMLEAGDAAAVAKG